MLGVITNTLVTELLNLGTTETLLWVLCSVWQPQAKSLGVKRWRGHSVESIE